MLRVITGKAKGHRLKAPKGLSTRPTTDRVKESLFNIIGLIPSTSTVLDLFSGTGNIGIEFLSRGAQECIFIDNSYSSIKIINENLSNTRLLQQSQVFKNDVNNVIRILGKKKRKFNYIFMDPPYEKDLALPTLENICHEEILEGNGLVIVEHESQSSFPEKVSSMHKIDSRRYGGTTITFFKHKEEE